MPSLTLTFSELPLRSDAFTLLEVEATIEYFPDGEAMAEWCVADITGLTRADPLYGVIASAIEATRFDEVDDAIREELSTYADDEAADRAIARRQEVA